MQNLESIYNWLDQNAPQIKGALQLPASISLLERVEGLVGLPLPADFKNLYSTHNGLSPDITSNFFYGMTFIPLERVMMHLEAIAKRETDFNLQFADEGIRRGYRLSKTRVPIADDYGTSLLCVDLDPDENGTVGQIVFIDYKMDTGLLLASSVTELLKNFASDLESGKYKLLEEAKIDGAEWLEPEKSIDIVNWFNSPTWSYAST